MQEFFTSFCEWVLRHPVWTLAVLVGVFVAWKIWRVGFYIFNARYRLKNLVYLRITLPREDSPKDKEHDTEKDFREKIGVMEQLFRSLHEIRELNVPNMIWVWFFGL